MDSFEFKAPVKPGDTLCCEVTVAGAKETSDGRRGVLSQEIKVLKVRYERAEEVLAYSTRVLMKRKAAP